MVGSGLAASQKTALMTRLSMGGQAGRISIGKLMFQAGSGFAALQTMHSALASVWVATYARSTIRKKRVLFCGELPRGLAHNARRRGRLCGWPSWKDFHLKSCGEERQRGLADNAHRACFSMGV